MYFIAIFADEIQTKVHAAFEEVNKAHPNVFMLKDVHAVCVDCKDFKLSLATKNSLFNAGNHVKGAAHKKASKSKGASSSHRINTFFKAQGKRPSTSTESPPPSKRKHSI